MTSPSISADFPFTKERVAVLDSTIAYVDTGLPAANAPTVVFLHGNPTSSYLYRNIIPHISPIARCIAPDLVGFGDSGKMPSNGYYVREHVQYIAAFLDAVAPKEQTEELFLVIHDWGSALGFDWASKNPSRVAGLVFMEFICAGKSLQDLPEAPRTLFTNIRTEKPGREMIIDQNLFIEVILGRDGTARDLSEAEMRHYRKPFLDPKDREPLYRFPNEIPFDGNPTDVAKMVDDYWTWLEASEVPKLMFWAAPGRVNPMAKLTEIEASFKNLKSVGIGPGTHYLQEENPTLIGEETRKFILEVINKA
ncbi:putative Haloalkane dehalogenase [Microthyrium microscopicum]|uniref:Putative Haloalkane dehalogenase n=1 Tax=Microthyrium microscopicum TaxID=703497 RepID=A0A6A6UUX7_9PEZI|nr:putative Haloalkane dehalogenase [Microthyrium microscopicum]